jgi:hypothetical protein
LTKSHDQTRRAFVVQFVAEPGVDGIKAFRSLLKAALRHYGLRAIDVRECEPARVRLSSGSPTRESPMSEFSKRIRGKESGFFKVADLENGERMLTILRLDEDVVMFDVPRDILNFVETGKQLTLNQTNAEFLLDNFGDEPATYEGKRVVLFIGEYTYEGKKGSGVRLKLPGAPAAKPSAPSGARSAFGAPHKEAPRSSNGGTADPDDTIPF